MREGGRKEQQNYQFWLFLVCLCIRGLNRSLCFVQCIFILVTSKTLTLYDTTLLNMSQLEGRQCCNKFQRNHMVKRRQHQWLPVPLGVQDYSFAQWTFVTYCYTQDKWSFMIPQSTVAGSHIYTSLTRFTDSEEISLHLFIHFHFQHQSN